MNTTKYQKAQYVRDMLAEEAAHGLNMQLVLAGLPDEDLRVMERVAQQCRSARGGQSSRIQTISFVVDMEE
ncbi:MAG: hypothetical protein HC884_11710 [Chloroflexaceae bacterium]|nr:hypothetical protein [Chloroflexaceae bacterium]